MSGDKMKKLLFLCLFVVAVVCAFVYRYTHEPDTYDFPPMVYVYGKSYITYSNTWPSDTERERLVQEGERIGIVSERKGEPDNAAIVSPDEPEGAEVYVHSEYPDVIFVKSKDRINLYEDLTNRSTSLIVPETKGAKKH